MPGIELKLTNLTKEELRNVVAALAGGMPLVDNTDGGFMCRDELVEELEGAELGARLAEIANAASAASLSEDMKMDEQGGWTDDVMAQHEEDDTPLPPEDDDVPPPPADEDTPPPPADAVELDSAGHPHDARIHSSGKTKYSKKGPNGEAGTWQLKRGADKELVAKLRASPATVPAPPQDEPTSTVDDDVETRSPLTYISIAQRITSNISPVGTLDPIALGAMLSCFGLTGLPDLQNHPELLQQVNDRLDELLGE